MPGVFYVAFCRKQEYHEIRDCVMRVGGDNIA